MDTNIGSIRYEDDDGPEPDGLLCWIIDVMWSFLSFAGCTFIGLCAYILLGLSNFSLSRIGHQVPVSFGAIIFATAYTLIFSRKWKQEGYELPTFFISFVIGWFYLNLLEVTKHTYSRWNMVTMSVCLVVMALVLLTIHTWFDRYATLKGGHDAQQ